MIATHNIKVNGRWIHPGERYGEPEEKPIQKKQEPVQEEPANVEAPVEEKPKAESKPRTAPRRKVSK